MSELSELLEYSQNIKDYDMLQSDDQFCLKRKDSLDSEANDHSVTTSSSYASRKSVICKLWNFKTLTIDLNQAMVQAAKQND